MRRAVEMVLAEGYKCNVLPLRMPSALMALIFIDPFTFISEV